MSSGQEDGQDSMGDGFTIPKRIPKKRKDGAPPSSPSLLPLQAPGQARPNRKVLPTRASRTSDAKSTPEWEAMSKLVAQFHARADAGDIVVLFRAMTCTITV